MTQLDHYTVDDLERVSVDGTSRYEVLNGGLHVTPSNAYAHNRRVQRIGLALAAAVPAGLEVLMAGTQAVRVGQDGPCPDVLVVVEGDYGLAIPAEAVRLVVEVTSPSGRRTDTVTKLDLYARAGIEHYWVVDPDEIVVHTLGASGSYRVMTRGAAFEVDEPFRVDVRLD